MHLQAPFEISQSILVSVVQVPRFVMSSPLKIVHGFGGFCDNWYSSVRGIYILTLVERIRFHVEGLAFSVETLVNL